MFIRRNQEAHYLSMPLTQTKLSAPKKEIVWFENSAHIPFFEELERFVNEVKRIATENQN